MRTFTLLIVLGLTTLTSQQLMAQCQRGGGGGSRGMQRMPPSQEGGAITQTGVDPVFAQMRQQAIMQQRQFAFQQMRMQQFALQQRQAQMQQAQLVRRRDAAMERRSTELALRERVRAKNLARLETRKSQATLVAMLSK